MPHAALDNGQLTTDNGRNGDLGWTWPTKLQLLCTFSLLRTFKSCLSGKTTIYSAVSHWEGQTTSVKRKERLPTSNYLTRGFLQARTSDYGNSST